MKVAVVGATGLVGSVMIRVLEERGFPVTELIPVASEKQKEREVVFNGNKIKVINLKDAVDRRPDIALFSAGSEVSLNWAPKFADSGTYVIDNSSAWRMEKGIKLIVPEINAGILTKEDHIIANPNCSTIQLVMVLDPLHRKYHIKRIVVSTYQSVTGSGSQAVDQLGYERAGLPVADPFYPHQIDMNVIPHCDVFVENGYTKEEMKLVNETQKILNDYNLKITATAVRVPVEGGHSESVNIEFENDFIIRDIRDLLQSSEGIVLHDNPENNLYPMPVNAKGKDDVFAGRIRRDFSRPNSLNLWIVADNLRKGAATNAVQIAEYIVREGIVRY
jgi:aspartate-semialdehyde dehydrogenase